jgi:hypothetical protein
MRYPYHIVIVLCLSSFAFGQESEDDIIRAANAEVKMLRSTVRRQHNEIEKLRARAKYLESRYGDNPTVVSSQPIIKPTIANTDKPIDGAIVLRKLAIGAGLIDQHRRGIRADRDKTEQGVRDGLQALLAKTGKELANKKIVLKAKIKSVTTSTNETTMILDSLVGAGKYISPGFSILFHNGNMVGNGGFVSTTIPMKVVLQGSHNIPTDKIIEITGFPSIKISLLGWTPSHTTAEDYHNLIAFIGIPGNEETDNRNVRVWKAYFAVCMSDVSVLVDEKNIPAKAQPLGVGE